MGNVRRIVAGNRNTASIIRCSTKFTIIFMFILCIILSISLFVKACCLPSSTQVILTSVRNDNAKSLSKSHNYLAVSKNALSIISPYNFNKNGIWVGYIIYRMIYYIFRVIKFSIYPHKILSFLHYEILMIMRYLF